MPIAFTKSEGEVWRAWEDRFNAPPGVYAVLFDDGSVFDVHSGWRGRRENWWDHVKRALLIGRVRVDIRLYTESLALDTLSR